jgi:DNA-binding CsgD family transcriptional regulator
MAKTAETLETIDLLYRAALEPALWRDALHQFALATGGVGTAMIPITPGNISGLIVSPALDESNVEYSREWWRYDSRVLRIYSRKLSDGVCCEAELFTDDELARDPLRQEFLRSYGIGAFAAQLVMPLPNFVVAFSVQRALEHGHFERRHLDTLNLLGKHAARALLISTHLTSAYKIERGLADALSHLDCGALIVDHEMRVILANGAAERLMGDGLSICQGRLRASSTEQQIALACLLRGAIRKDEDGGGLETIALARPSGRKPLLAQAIPLAPDALEGPLPSDAVALIIVIDPEQSSAAKPFRELCLLGLTRAEARLALLIGAGLTRPDAAEMLGISPATASDTAKQIYWKLDISSQSELVKLIDRLGVMAVQKSESEV